jgi:hypothetical protein
VKYLAADRESNDAIATVIGGRHGRVDTVIANAGEILVFRRHAIIFDFDMYSY